MPKLTWDIYRCPYCGDDAVMGLMSLVARSHCGAMYVEDYPNSRWYLPYGFQGGGDD